MTDIELLRRPVPELAALVRGKELAARELVDASLAAIDERDEAINAFVAVDPERARRDAAAVDERVAAGRDPGPLAGIPLAVKDLEDAAGYTTTYGSAVHRDDPPSTGDSILVARLKAAGCVVVGKTNTPEHGWKADTVNGWGGATANPWGPGRSAGGSSGGSAAALAAGMVPLATGSDGGGSIRIPSALCGLSGFKASLGRVPSGGPRAPGWLDFSTRGVMTRKLRDAVGALDVAVAPDPTDLRSLPAPEVPWSRSLDDLGAPLRVAWSPTLGYAKVDAEVAAVCAKAVEVLAGAGTDVDEVPSVFDEDPAWSWFTVAASCNERTVGPLRDTDAWERVDPGLRETADIARSRFGPVDVVKALDDCHRLNVRLVELFRRHSLLLCPTVAGQAGQLGEHGTVDGTAAVTWVAFTYGFNMTRSPAGSVCAGFTSDGMPVGLQIIGPQHADVAVLRAMALLEDALGLDTVPAAFR
jgi:Asp-tRNA(Asn)/Glu-tRNA(Gln) amidotransferase A subunit family amidase